MEIDKTVLGSLSKRDSNTAVYTVLFKGGTTKDNSNTGCHYSLWKMDEWVKREFVPLAVVNKRCYPERTSEGSEMYYDWLLNRSPFASAFITKDAKIANETHQVLDCCVPSMMFGTAIVGTRAAWEQPKRLDLFGELVKLGCEEGLAYGLCSCYTLDSDNQPLREARSSHWMVKSDSGVPKLLIHNLPLPEIEDKPYCEAKCWDGAQDWLGSLGHESVWVNSVVQQLAREFNAESKVSVTKKTCLNIFPKAKVEPTAINVSDVAKALIKLSHEAWGLDYESISSEW